MKRLALASLVLGLSALACEAALGLASYRNCSGGECEAADGEADGAAGDSGVASDAPPDSPGVLDGSTPADLFNADDLAVWLEASKNVTLSDDGGADGGAPHVLSWGDVRGGQTPGYAVALQSNPNRQPQFSATSFLSHAEIGFFDTTRGIYISDTARVRFGVQPFLVAAVVRLTNNGGAALYFWNKARETGVMSKTFQDGLIFGVAFSPAGNINNPAMRLSVLPDPLSETHVYSGSDNTQLDLGAHVVVARRISTDGATDTVQLRIDGAAARRDVNGNGTSNNLDNVGDPVQLGAVVTTTTPVVNGTSLEIAELVAVSRPGPIEDAEVLALEAYFKAKYGL